MVLANAITQMNLIQEPKVQNPYKCKELCEILLLKYYAFVGEVLLYND